MAQRVWILASVVAVGLLGCPRPEPAIVPAEDGDGAGESETGDAEPEPPSGVCGTPAQRFDDYAWVPDDSRTTTALLREDPQLDAALRVLIELVDSKAIALPIHAALDYRNLGFQRLGVDRILATLELDPSELVELHGPDGDVVWLWPSDCPTTTLATRALDRLGVQLRVDFERPGIRVGAGARERFPFDLVVLHERAVALAPLGRGAAIGAWLSAPRRAEHGPGAALESIDAAPIRLVLSGPALLEDSPAPAPVHAGAHRLIRVTATEWVEVTPDPSP